MKIWVDDVRPAPNDEWVWCKSVNDTINTIIFIEDVLEKVNVSQHKLLEVIDIDHDAGDYVSDGGDYIRLLDWLEETGRNYPIHIHSMNPVGVQNMRAIIQHNKWREV